VLSTFFRQLLGRFTAPTPRTARPITLSLFIGDAATAQLLFLNASLGSEAECAPALVFTMENWVQLGLAGSMWLLGAVLWVMELAIYWVSVEGGPRQSGRRKLCVLGEDG
jgi:hypothetical protein